MVKVADASAGERVLFRLRSQDGQQGTAVVNLEPGKTMGGYLWIFTPKVLTDHVKFTGTVEYEGRPEQTWTIESQDPTSRFIKPDVSEVSLFVYVHRNYINGHVEVRLGEDDVQLFRSMKPFEDLKH